MRKNVVRFIAPLLLLPALCWGQSNPQPPAAWVAFQQQENAKRVAFFKQLKADRDAFMQANPEMKAYFQQMHAIAQARLAAWKASHPPKHL